MKHLLVRWLSICSLILAVRVTERPISAAAVVQILVTHSDGKIKEIAEGVSKTPEGFPIDSSPTFEAKKESKVLVTIFDPNPLLFKYTLKKGAAVETSNQKALGSFTDSLGGFINNIDPKTLQESVSEEFRVAKPRETQIWECPTKIKELGTLNVLAPQIDRAATAREGIAGLSLTDHKEAKKALVSWSLGSWSKDLTAVDQGLEKIAGKLLTNSASPEEEACKVLITLAKTEIPHIRKLLDDLTDFAKQVNLIDKPITLEAFNVNIAEDQPIEVKIAKTESFPASLESSLFVGDTTFTVSPLSRVAITVGAAAVYSFVTAPTFSAAISGGQIVIKQVKSDYKKLDVAAMLEIEPRAWDLGPLNLGVQLGVSPKSDIGLFLGLSLRATGFFTLGAGIAFQQVDRLAPGLSVGQMIASPDALKTEKKFRSGLYIHLTVTTQKKK